MEQQVTPHFIRGAFYSLTVVLGFAVALTELDNQNTKGFWFTSFIVAIVFAIELYTGWEFQKRGGQSKTLTSAQDYGHSAQLIHHVLMPLGVYVSTALFGYYNQQSQIRVAILVLVFGILAVLFTRIRAFYHNRTTVIAQTNYIYDLVKLIIFFNVVDTLANITYYQNISGVGTGLSITALTFLLAFLNAAQHHQFSTKIVGIIVGLAVLLGIAVAVVYATGTNPLQTSVVATVGYYLISATLHHVFHGDLTWGIAAEYVLVAISLVAILLSLNT